MCYFKSCLLTIGINTVYILLEFECVCLQHQSFFLIIHASPVDKAEYYRIS